MKKAILCGKRDVRIVEVPDPKPKGDWALVKVHAAPLCAEYKAYVAGHADEHPGHEAGGEVVAVDVPGCVAVGTRVVVMPQTPCGQCALCKAGDYIYCESNQDFAAVHGSPEGRGTLAQYLLKPSWLLLPIPDGMSYEHASLACCGLGPSFGAFERMRVGAEDTVLIAGAGPVGLGALTHARFRGARAIVVESAPWRAERAQAMGADCVRDPRDTGLAAAIRERTGGRGVDAAIDCSGTVGGQRICIEATRRLGRVAFIGECNDELPIRVSPDLIRKGLTIMGSWHYNLAGFKDILRVIQESPLIPLLISHVMPLSDIERGLDLCTEGRCAKVILKPWA